MELCLQLRQPAVDVAKAHAAVGERDDLRLQRLRDLADAAIQVRQDGIEGGYDRLLERHLVQRGRAVAVFLAVVQAAHTAPHDALSVGARPCAAAVQRSALAAHQPVREGVAAGVGDKTGGGSLGGAFCRLAPRHLRLHRVVLLAADNALMVVLYEVHGKLPRVFDDLAVDDILLKGLLHQHVAAVFLIPQDAFDMRQRPLR